MKNHSNEAHKRNHNLIEGLRSAGIECLKGNAGLFCWINLTPLLEKASRESELEVWRKILEEAKLNILPGSSCHCSEAGWFRVYGTSLILSFPDVLIHTRLRTLKIGADGSRIGSRKVYSLDSIRKPVIPPRKGVGEIFGREKKNEGQGNHEEEEEEDDGWVDWDDKILEDTVPLVSFVKMILHSGI